MLALQGMPMPTDVRLAGISNCQLGLMIGTAMSVTVLERLLVRLRLLPGVGLRPPAFRFTPDGPEGAGHLPAWHAFASEHVLRRTRV
jgi:hypothetical protein